MIRRTTPRMEEAGEVVVEVGRVAGIGWVDRRSWIVGCGGSEIGGTVSRVTVSLGSGAGVRVKSLSPPEAGLLPLTRERSSSTVGSKTGGVAEEEELFGEGNWPRLSFGMVMSVWQNFVGVSTQPATSQRQLSQSDGQA